jgi:hypothetical protein
MMRLARRRAVGKRLGIPLLLEQPQYSSRHCYDTNRKRAATLAAHPFRTGPVGFEYLKARLTPDVKPTLTFLIAD